VKYTLRALLALGLLVGFYVFAVGVVVALGWGVVELARVGLTGYVLAKLGFFVVVLGFVVLRALFGRRKNRATPSIGLLLTEQAEPALWAEVRRIAEFAGTRPPDEIRLVPEVNAAVTEDAKWLGLVAGTRRLYLGVPLMLGLTSDQLRSVIAHELGHYSGRHTALSAITYRGQIAIARVIQGLGVDSLAAKIFKLYARLYYAVSHSVNRRQELEADTLSAALVGSATASSALRELHPLSAAWTFYVDSYADLGSSIGHRPTDLYDGFSRFLASPARQDQLAEMRADSAEPPRSVFDTHPPTSERIARLVAIDRASSSDESGPAAALLAGGTLERAQEAVWEGDSRAAAPLAAIVPLAGAEVLRHNAQIARAQLHALGASPDLTGALEVFRSGRSAELLRPLSPNAEEDDLRHHAGRLVGDLAALHLVETERAHHRLNYDSDWLFTDSDGNDIEPWPAAVAASTDPAEVDAFEAWLLGHSIDLAPSTETIDVALPGPALPPPLEVLAACAPVGGGFRTVVVLGQGILLRKASTRDRVIALRAAFHGNVGRSMIKHALKRGTESLLAAPRPKSALLRWDDITSATFRAKRLQRGVLSLECAGRTVTLKLTMETEHVGDPVAAIEHLLGNRFHRI